MSRALSPEMFAIGEILQKILEEIDDPPQLVHCACVNHQWYQLAMRKLYRGSEHNFKLRTPDIESLNSLYIASRTRFAENISNVKHLVLSSDPLAIKSEYAQIPMYGRYLPKASAWKLSPLSHGNSEFFQKLGGTSLHSLAIPFVTIGQDLYGAFTHVVASSIESLTIDVAYCTDLLRCYSLYTQGGHLQGVRLSDE